MVYQFKIYSTESKTFQLNLSLDGNHTFYDFHNLIQNSLGFETLQLASFFISDAHWKKQKEISLLDSGLNGPVYFNMHKTRIENLLTNAGQKLVYTFDFFNDRSFYIELTGIIMEQNLLEPLITLKKGESPQQILGEKIMEGNHVILQEEEVLMDFGELEDYARLYGDMEDF